MGAPLYDPEHDVKIVSWRWHSFGLLGFSHDDARALAMRRDIDREDVAKLRSRGCTPEQVMAIVL